jgi:hypothetical protein
MGERVGLLSALRQCKNFCLPQQQSAGRLLLYVLRRAIRAKKPEGKFGAKVLDGEFKTKCERLAASNNPTFSS